MSINLTEKSVTSLVESRFEKAGLPPHTLFITISPNPETLHQYPQNLKTKLRYDRLPQRIQFAYCIHVVKKLQFYLAEGTTIIGTWELNESKNVHLHLLVIDPTITNITHLSILQREIALSCEALRNMKKVRNPKDWMHNIVFINKPTEWYKTYMDKDYILNKGLFKNIHHNVREKKEQTHLDEPVGVEHINPQNYLFKIII